VRTAALVRARRTICNQNEKNLSHKQRLVQEGNELVEQKSENPVQIVEKPSRWLGWSSFIFATMQGACAFVVATSSIRVLIGLSALAAAAGTDAPARGFHQDAIRIPMMIFALAGAMLNLYALWRVRSLRRRPSAQWRVQPVTSKQLHSEQMQIALSILTLILLAAEWWTHSMLHHPHH
jgi:hypothetical protein